MPTVINLDIGPQFLFGHTKPFLPAHDNVIIYNNIVKRFGYLSKSLGFFSGGSSPSSGSPPTISFSRLSTLSVITLMGRKFVEHLHPAGAFAPIRNVPVECVFGFQGSRGNSFCPSIGRQREGLFIDPLNEKIFGERKKPLIHSEISGLICGVFS